MKKMYFLAVLLIFVICVGFLLFSCDENMRNKRFLSSYGIKTEETPTEYTQIEIPDEFDTIYEEYNFLQIQSGLDLTPYRGKRVIRRSYRVLNFPCDVSGDVYANVLTYLRKPIGGDINCPALSGFILPLSYIRDITQ